MVDSWDRLQAWKPTTSELRHTPSSGANFTVVLHFLSISCALAPGINATSNSRDDFTQFNGSNKVYQVFTHWMAYFSNEFTVVSFSWMNALFCHFLNASILGILQFLSHVDYYFYPACQLDLAPNVDEVIRCAKFWDKMSGNKPYSIFMIPQHCYCNRLYIYFMIFSETVFQDLHLAVHRVARCTHNLWVSGRQSQKVVV